MNGFDLTDKVALVTGGSGVLGAVLASGLARAGARVALLGRNRAKAEAVAERIRVEGGEAMTLTADVRDRAQLEAARAQLSEAWGGLDVLLNGAGGNVTDATVTDARNFFGLPVEALEEVVGLNLLGTMLPSQVFGEVMAAAGRGSIINLSSMAASRPLSRVVGYGAAKAAVENFTRWFAVELAQRHSAQIRVNAIAPGFFIGEQNRALLLNADGSRTARGQQIIAHTPMGRFGAAEDLVGTAVWLASDASRFVTGIIVPVDGGFSASSGV